MDLGIKNRVAMVAAGSKGLGFATAQALAREGCRVSICGRDPRTLEQALKALKPSASDVVAVRADVSREEDLRHWHEQTCAAFGPVDILVTNTGGPKAAPFAGLSDADWQDGIESTLMNLVRMCRLVLPEMRERAWGRIVHITSLVAKQPMPLLTISSTLRAGISALTKTLAQECAPHGITVNALLPGHILTDRQRHLAELRAQAEGLTMEEILARTAASIPAGRIGSPEEVGEVIAFLCSQRAAYVTGVSLQVDGGLIQSTF